MQTDYLNDLRQDTTFALRALGRQKTWTTIATLTLALGIGATTAVFGVVSTFLLHPLSLPDAGRIVRVEQTPAQPGPGAKQMWLGALDPTARAWFAYSHTIEAFGGFQPTAVGMRTATGDQSTEVASRILPTFFDFARQHPLLGREFTTSDIENGSRVVLLSEGFWRERLAANPNVLGQRITLDDSAFTVIGVMPATFSVGMAGASPTSLWLPLDDRANGRGMSLYARLRPGATLETAKRELDSIAVRTGTASGIHGMRFETLLVNPADETRLKSGLLMLAAAAGLVLLVACANVAHLMMARASARRRELAIRTALGADRGRLLRQLLTESFILTAAGTAAGVVVGWLGLGAIVAVRPAGYDLLRASHIDGTTLAIVVIVAMMSGLAFGVMGSVQSARESTHNALKDSASSVSSSRAHWRMRSVLVVTEMALSAMLLVGAAMLVRSVTKLLTADLGFDPGSLYSVSQYVPDARVPTPQSYMALMTELEARVRRIPGVRDVAVAMSEPGGRVFDAARIEVDGLASPAGTAPSMYQKNFVQPGFFHTMGIALVAGTTFTDSTPASQQIIVNEDFARQHWGPSLAAALGHRVRLAHRDTEPWLTIVGVAHEAETAGPTYGSPPAMFYTPWTGDAEGRLIVRTSDDAAPLAQIGPLVRSMGLERAPQIAPASAAMDRSTSEPRFMMTVLSVFTAIALMLASLGLYGVMAYTVAQRTREIGIRIALGATSARVASAVARRGAALAFAGAMAGLVAAVWGTKVIEHELHGVSRLDLPSFVAGAAVLLFAAAMACVVPARRAIRIDPMSAIRSE